MANYFATAANLYSGGGYSAATGSGGSGGGTTDIFSPTGGNASASNQGITFGNTASQSLASSLPLVVGLVVVGVIGLVLLTRRR